MRILYLESSKNNGAPSFLNIKQRGLFKNCSGCKRCNFCHTDWDFRNEAANEKIGLICDTVSKTSRFRKAT